MHQRPLRRFAAATTIAITATLTAGCASSTGLTAKQPRSIEQLQQVAERINATAPDYALGSGDTLGRQVHLIRQHEALAASH